MTNFQPDSRNTAILGKSPCQKVVKLHLYCHDFWNTCPEWIQNVFLYSSCHALSKNINFIWFLGGPKFDLMTSIWRHLANLHKFLYSFEKTIRIYLSMPNFKSISFKVAVLEGGVCYPKDPMWNRVKWFARPSTADFSGPSHRRQFGFQLLMKN